MGFSQIYVKAAPLISLTDLTQPTDANQTITAGSGDYRDYIGFSSVTLKKLSAQIKNVSSLSDQIQNITPDSGYDYLSKVVIPAQRDVQIDTVVKTNVALNNNNGLYQFSGLSAKKDASYTFFCIFSSTSTLYY